jgi:hypothetical protein
MKRADSQLSALFIPGKQLVLLSIFNASSSKGKVPPAVTQVEILHCWRSTTVARAGGPEEPIFLNMLTDSMTSQSA